eukprot:11134424-Heterocapsa_arctica.AAC.1
MLELQAAGDGPRPVIDQISALHEHIKSASALVYTAENKASMYADVAEALEGYGGLSDKKAAKAGLTRFFETF